MLFPKISGHRLRHDAEREGATTVARDEDAARRAFMQAMSRRGLGPTDLARESGLDVKTVRNFLRGGRWPQQANRARFEASVGLPANALEDYAEGRPVGDERSTPHLVDLSGLTDRQRAAVVSLVASIVDPGSKVAAEAEAQPEVVTGSVASQEPVKSRRRRSNAG